MSQADRAFGVLLARVLASSALLALPLALTLFPGAIQHSLHASETVVRTCVAAIYAIGRDLPPLGAVIVTLALGSVTASMIRLVGLLRRTARATRRTCVAAPAPLLAAAERTGVASALRTFDDHAPLAYTGGLLRPRIFISTALVAALNPDELDAVLLHEREHLRRYDPLRVLLARVFSFLSFLVPWIRVQAARLEVAKELDADRAALRLRGPASLAGALVALGGPRPLPDLAIGAWSMTELRVDHLCGEDPASLNRPGIRRDSAALIHASGTSFPARLGSSCGLETRHARSRRSPGTVSTGLPPCAHAVCSRFSGHSLVRQ